MYITKNLKKMKFRRRFNKHHAFKKHSKTKRKRYVLRPRGGIRI